MLEPKQAGFYPDRDIDCQEAVAQGIADLIEQAALSGKSEDGAAAAAIANTAIPGIRDLINDAIMAGWTPEEASSAIKIVSAGMYRGFTGAETDE